MAARPTSFFSLNGPLFSPTTPAHAEHSWPAKWNPLQLRPWFVGLLAGLYLALAVGIEVAYAFSVRNHGFNASDSPWSLSSTQFLKSFLSSLLITPLGYLLSKQDEFIKLLQPYVDLAESSATAERSLLLDYVTANSLQSIYRGALNKHTVIAVSASACVISMLLQPLAGSLFTIRPTQITLPQSTAFARTQLGLDPTFVDLEAFVAAAGFAEAAAFHNLTDPPFITGTWAVTEFEIPDGSKGNNGSASVITVGVRSEPNCEAPLNVQLAGPGANGSYTLDARFSTCTGQVEIDPRFGDTAGVQAAPQCAANTGINDSRAPAAFWFFLSNPVNATVILCKPDVQVFNVNATVNATTNELSDVSIIDDYAAPNTVITFLSRGSLNAIAFDNTDFGDVQSNSLVLARAISTQGQLPALILKSAQLQVGYSSQQQFQGFSDITAHVYQQYLALLAKSIFFGPRRVAVPATIQQYQARLWLDPLACHSLTIILCLIAFLVVYANWSHHATRSRIYLACPPGTIASAITLTSNSRWTAMIGPADDAAGVTKKLRNLRFRLDPITHHIIVEGEPLGQPRNAVPPNAPMLDARMSTYSKSTLTPTPGENKHFSFQAGPNMVQSPMSPQPFSPQPYSPQPFHPQPYTTYNPQPFTATVPPEHQALLSPNQRVGAYGDVTGGPPSPFPSQPATPGPA